MGGAAFASSIYSAAYAADKAFDGNSGTVWSASSINSWLAYELPNVSNVNAVMLECRTDQVNQPNQPQDFTVKSSDDSTNGADGTWTDEWSVSNQTGWTEGESREFVRP